MSKTILNLVNVEALFTLWVPIAIAVFSLSVNVIQLFTYRKVRNKISIWARDSKSMISSIVDVQKNIKNKKIATLDSVSSNLDILSNFANSMFVSMAEELGHNKREIKATHKVSSKKREK